MVRKDYLPQEIYSLDVFPDAHFSRMKRQFKTVKKKCLNKRNCVCKNVFIFRYNDEIIRVSRIVLYLQGMLHKLIKLVHIDIRKNLRGEIADWYTFFRGVFFTLSLSLSLS